MPKPVPPKPVPQKPFITKYEPKAEFKSLQPISLKKISEEKDNQRKPDVQRVSALRDALKAVVDENKITNNQPQITNNTQIPNPKLEPKQGPSPEELKKILDVS